MRALAIVALFGCHASPTPESPPAPTTTFLKGQLHAHSNHSGDSATAPEDVARWYAARHFDFLVFTDHNVVTVIDSPVDGMLALPGVEITQNLETCDPPPPDPALGCLLHVNALVTTDTTSHGIDMPVAVARLAIYANALDQTTQLGGLAQLNHPNFHWGADAALLTALAHRGLRLFEVANQSSDIANPGDATHPSTEVQWDAVLTAGETLYGTATDDAHQYDDAEAFRARGHTPDTGDHGWVMVRAARDPAAIRAALARGDFYASTGVTLTRLERTADALVIEATTDVEVRFIGRGGKELARAHGRTARFPLADALRGGGYVRADVIDAAGHRAWVQPIR